MENTNKPTGGGVYLSPNLKKKSVVIDKDGNVIEVKTQQEKDAVIRANLNK